MKLLLATLWTLSTPLLLAVDSPPAEANAVVEKAVPFRLQVSELTSSSFSHTAPDGSKQKLFATSKTAVSKGDRSAVFGDIKLGDIITGLRVKKEAEGEWDIVNITNIESPAAPKR